MNMIIASRLELAKSPNSETGFKTWNKYCSVYSRVCWTMVTGMAGINKKNTLGIELVKMHVISINE